MEKAGALNPGFEKGFSLIEVITAVAVLSIGLLAVFGVFVYTLKGDEHADKMGEAVAADQSLLNLVRESCETSFNSCISGGLNFSEKPLTNSPYASYFSNPADASFLAAVNTQGLNIITGGNCSGPTSPSYQCIVVITVAISWKRKGGESHVTLVAYQGIL
jgi:prepilin-type N-terminal cleavage/methylation domain-containing protein